MATPLYCRKCGTRLPTDSLFCPACGTSQTGADHAPTSPQQQEPVAMGTGRQPAGHMLHQRYRLLHTVGQGGMGAVYVAQDTQLGDRFVAVKEMSMSRLKPEEVPQAIEQFRREAHLLASLQHPNLPVIHEYFQEADRWYLVMSFIEGQNLQATLNTSPGNRLPVNEVVLIGTELCEVLEYLHTHKPQIIFRDLKPLNIMLTPKGHICLIDFGIARHFKQEQTKDTSYYYSVGYAPPEQYGQSQTGPQSDIYSLGATLHQMLSGHNPASKPFQFPNLQLVDPTIPVPLAKLIAQMLEMNEQARPANVAEVKAQLEQVFAPRQIEPTRKAVAEEKAQREAKSVSPELSVAPALARSGLWGRIDSFLSKRQRLAWICFIFLSLTIGGILPWLSWGLIHSASFPFEIANVSGAPPFITIIGAVGAAGVGLIFLLFKKRRPLLEILGGFALGGIVFINLALSQYWHVYNLDYDYYYYSGGYLTYFPVHYLDFFIFLALFSLWLFVGVRFLVRSANTTGSLLVGILLILGGFSLLWPRGVFTLSLITVLPTLMCGVCGAIAISPFSQKN